jgi:RNA polymerase sigma-70 factor, ECF subfamily
MTQASQDVTQLLAAWRDGDQQALDRLMPLVYNELRRLAHRYMKRQKDGQTLQTTAVVHEAYLRLAGRDEVNWQNRAHFFAVCAQVMRNLLVDRARARSAEKRGGGTNQVALDESDLMAPGQLDEVLELNEALDKLSQIDPRKSKIIEMRYFGGMSVEETAAVLELSPITIKREWLKARAWLYLEMNKVS